MKKLLQITVALVIVSTSSSFASYRTLNPDGDDQKLKPANHTSGSWSDKLMQDDAERRAESKKKFDAEFKARRESEAKRHAERKEKENQEKIARKELESKRQAERDSKKEQAAIRLTEEQKQLKLTITQSGLSSDHWLDKIKEAEASQKDMKQAFENLKEKRSAWQLAQSKGVGISEAFKEYLSASDAFQAFAPNKG